MPSVLSSLSPVLANFDWDQVFYFLIPLVYIAAQFFGGDKEAKEKKKQQKRERELEGGKPPSTEAQDRLKRVQDEIRRKIAERQEEMRRAMSGEARQAEAPRESAPPPPPPAYDPNLPEWAQRRDASRPPPPPRREEGPAPDEPAVPVRQGSEAPAAPQESSLDRQLREQRAKLERAKRERAKAFAKTGGRRASEDHYALRAPSVSETRDHVLEVLGSPGSARNAIILAEVLGRPRALRPFEDAGDQR